MQSVTIGKSWYLWPAGAALVFGASQTSTNHRKRNIERELLQEACVKTLLSKKGARIVPSAGQMLRRHGIAGKMIAQDHWFDTLESEQMVKEMLCIYDKTSKEFHTIVKVGRDVCGYPRTVHGGLTAAIVDETFGGLYVCLWTSGYLGLTTPGLTARLEVDYKKKLAADTIIVCSTEIESIDNRKVWMKAHVFDGMSGSECATARALFVAPRWRSVLPGFFRRRS